MLPSPQLGLTVRLVVMGVAGSGKTSVGERLAERYGARFVDADEAHPEANVAKMSAGIPLTDLDRRPWLAQLQRELADNDQIVITCSALKRAYREQLRRAGDVRFIYLAVEPATALDRVSARPDHFMGADMVASQFDTLEPPGGSETDVVMIEATGDLDTVVAAAIEALEHGLGAAPGFER